MTRRRKWAMVVDLDRCIGCQACVVACQAENNIALNAEDIVRQGRAIQWIRIERYWEGEYPDLKVRFLPVLCQHCGNAPCEAVCPVFAIHHSEEGLNVQVYNRCVGTRFCANACPYNVRYFNFWEREWPDAMKNQLNPDVTIRTKGLIEKCTFCIHRLRRAERRGEREGRELKDGEVLPACVQTCPTDTLIFGDINDPESQVAKLAQDPRRYRLLEELGTEPAVFYLKKVEPRGKAS